MLACLRRQNNSSSKAALNSSYYHWHRQCSCCRTESQKQPLKQLPNGLTLVPQAIGKFLHDAPKTACAALSRFFSQITFTIGCAETPIRDSGTRKLEHDPFTFNFSESLVLYEFDLSKIRSDLREHLDSRVEAAHLDSILSCSGSHSDPNLTSKVDSFFRTHSGSTSPTHRCTKLVSPSMKTSSRMQSIARPTRKKPIFK